MSLKLDTIYDSLATFISGRFAEVTQSHAFPTCEYPTALKILMDNRGRQTEAALFKAASSWILASTDRVNLAEEIFRQLGISQVGRSGIYTICMLGLVP